MVNFYQIFLRDYNNSNQNPQHMFYWLQVFGGPDLYRFQWLGDIYSPDLNKQLWEIHRFGYEIDSEITKKGLNIIKKYKDLEKELYLVNIGTGLKIAAILHYLKHICFIKNKTIKRIKEIVYQHSDKKQVDKVWEILKKRELV